MYTHMFSFPITPYFQIRKHTFGQAIHGVCLLEISIGNYFKIIKVYNLSCSIFETFLIKENIQLNNDFIQGPCITPELYLFLFYL